MRTLSTWILLAVCASAWPAAAAAGTLALDFASDPFGTHFDFTGDAPFSGAHSAGQLVIAKSADAGTEAVIQGQAASRFRLQGDYKVTVAFDLATFPLPGFDGGAAQFIDAHLRLLTGSSSIFVNRHASGSNSFRGGLASPGGVFSGQADSNRFGRFEIERAGQVVTARIVTRATAYTNVAHISAADGTIHTLATFDDAAFLGTAEVQLVVRQANFGGSGRVGGATSAVSVGFDNLLVTADTIVPEPHAVSLVAVAALAIAGRRRGREPRSLRARSVRSSRR